MRYRKDRKLKKAMAVFMAAAILGVNMDLPVLATDDTDRAVIETAVEQYEQADSYQDALTQSHTGNDKGTTDGGNAGNSENSAAGTHTGNENLIAYGHVNNSTVQGVDWSIDKNGKLTVTGTGDFKGAEVTIGGYDSVQFKAPVWSTYISYRDSIKTAVINLEEVTDASGMFYGCENLECVEFENFDTSAITNMAGMFDGCLNLKSIDISGFDTSNVINMGCMFQNCESLRSLDVSHFNTVAVTNMASMFNECHNLMSLDVSHFETGNVTDMTLMFGGCENLTQLDVSGFDTKKVTSLGGMFCNCAGLKSLAVDHFNTACVQSIDSIFYGCSSLETLDISGFDTSQVTDMMTDMFSGCSSLESIDVSNFDTGKVTDMAGMFRDCSSLASIDVSNFNTSNVEMMYDMFSGCSSLESIDISNFDTGKVAYMDGMFRDCSSLTCIDVSSFNTSMVVDMSYMFNGCSALESLDISGFSDSTEFCNHYCMFKGCSLIKKIKIYNTDYVYVKNEENEDGHLELPISPMYDEEENAYSYYPEGIGGIWLYADKDLFNKEPAPDQDDPNPPISVKYTLTFDVNGGNVLTDEADKRTILKDEVYGELPIVSRSGYTFAGWYTAVEDGDQVSAETICTGDMTIYAHWIKNEEENPNPGNPDPEGPTPSVPVIYTLTFDVNGGNALDAVVATRTLAAGTSFGELPTVSRESYTFAGWYTTAEGGEGVTADTVCTGDVTVYAHWTKNEEQQPDTPAAPEPEPENREGMKVRFIDEATGEAVAEDAVMTYTYTGSQIKPAILVTNNGEELTEGVDYTVKYANNINANATGTGTAIANAKLSTVTVTGKGNLTGNISLTFRIEQKDIADLDRPENIVTDNADSAVPILVYNGMVLAKNKDFSFTYKKAEAEAAGVAGSYTVIGEGNYTGTVSVNVIVKAKSELKKFAAKTVIPDKKAIIYDGEEKKITVAVTDAGKKTPLTENDYILVYGNNVDAGTAKVTVIGMGDYTGTKTLTFKINPSAEARVDVSGLANSYPFNNAAVTIDDDLKVTDAKGNVLTQGTDYKLTYSANTKVGTAKCKVTFLGNYKATKADTEKFTISNGELSDANTAVEIHAGDMAYTGKAGAYKSAVYVTVNGNALKKSDYAVSYYKDAARTQEIKKKADYISLSDDMNEATIYVKVAGKGNYASPNANTYATAEYKVVRNDSAVSLNKVKITILDDNGNKLKKAEYTGYAVEPGIKVEYKDSTKTWKTLSDGQYEISYQNNVNKGKATIVLTGNGTDTVGGKTVSFTIASKKIKAVK